MKLKRVLFVVSGTHDFPNLYVRSILPIVDYVKQKNVKCFILATTQPVYNWLTQNHVKSIFPKKFFLYTILGILAKLTRIFIIMLTFNFVPRLTGKIIGTRFFAKLYAILDKPFFQSIIQKHHPDLIFLIPDLAHIHLIKIARQHGIKTLTSVSAMMNDDYPYGILATDKIVLPGEAFKRIYLKRGTSPQRIEVTGMPHFDNLLSEYKLNRNLKNPLIVFVTESTNLKLTIQSLKETIKTTAVIKDSKLIIKVHPRENAKIYERVVQKAMNSLANFWTSFSAKVVKDVDLYNLLSQCNILVGSYSTCLLEAMIFDKPCIAVNLTGEPNRVPYTKYGATMGVYRLEDIGKAIQLCLFDEDTQNKLRRGREKFLEDYAYRLDGKACERIFNVMEDMVK